jgi:hypothetical protein
MTINDLFLVTSRRFSCSACQVLRRRPEKGLDLVVVIGHQRPPDRKISIPMVVLRQWLTAASQPALMPIVEVPANSDHRRTAKYTREHEEHTMLRCKLNLCIEYPKYKLLIFNGNNSYKCGELINSSRYIPRSYNHQPVRLAGGWWLVLVCSERRVLLASCWWLVCS